MTCETWQRLVLEEKTGKDVSRGQGGKDYDWGGSSSFMPCPYRNDCHKGRKSLTTASSVRSFLFVLLVICCCGTNYPET